MDIVIYIMTITSSMLVGAILNDIYLKYKINSEIKTIYKKPLDELAKRGLDIYKFSSRQGDWVRISFDNNKYISLDLKKKQLYVFENDIIIFSHHASYKKDYDNLYNKLYYKFYKEIEVDVANIQGVLYSLNIIPKNILGIFNLNKEEYIEDINYTVDDLLEKITNSGLKSLTDSEIEFLKNQK